MSKDKEQYSVITEQGDLGLGVHELTEEEQKKIKEKQKQEKH